MRHLTEFDGVSWTEINWEVSLAEVNAARIKVSVQGSGELGTIGAVRIEHILPDGTFRGTTSSFSGFDPGVPGPPRAAPTLQVFVDDEGNLHERFAAALGRLAVLCGAESVPEPF